MAEAPRKVGVYDTESDAAPRAPHTVDVKPKRSGTGIPRMAGAAAVVILVVIALLVFL